MSTKLDALVYQWVLTEKDKESPLVYAHLEEQEDAEKFKSLIEVHGHLVAELFTLHGDANGVVQTLSESLLTEFGKDFMDDASDDAVDVITSHEDVAPLFDLLENKQAELEIFETDLASALF